MPIFLDKKCYIRAFETMFYYLSSDLGGGFSNMTKLSSSARNNMLWSYLLLKKQRVEMISYCFMPNHFHFLVRQVCDDGISKFISDFTNSYTRYFNIRSRRVGPLFQGSFKAVLIETSEQLQHVARYIHLNPYTSYLVKNFEELKTYKYSSFPAYLNRKPTLLQRNYIMSSFSNTDKYKKFVFNHASYQRQLSKIKHLLLEK